MGVAGNLFGLPLLRSVTRMGSAYNTLLEEYSREAIYASRLPADSDFGVHVILKWHPKMTEEELQLVEEEKTKVGSIARRIAQASNLEAVVEGPFLQAGGVYSMRVMLDRP